VLVMQADAWGRWGADGGVGAAAGGEGMGWDRAQRPAAQAQAVINLAWWQKGVGCVVHSAPLSSGVAGAVLSACTPPPSSPRALRRLRLTTAAPTPPRARTTNPATQAMSVATDRAAASQLSPSNPAAQSHSYPLASAWSAPQERGGATHSPPCWHSGAWPGCAQTLQCATHSASCSHDC